jgi:alpha-galactosidase
MAWAAAKGPVKVFILSGQSNMEGKAAAYTLDAVINDPKTRDEFKHLKHGAKWAVRDDVWVTFLDNKVRGDSKLDGPLTVGFGSEKTRRDEQNKKVPEPGIGPELGIGRVLGDHFDGQVLLIKAAWGGRAVKYSFRPPSAIPSDDEIRAQVAGIEKNRQERIAREKQNPPKKAKPIPPERTFAQHKEGYGSDYRAILAETRNVLDDIKKHFPDYDPAAGYEIAGFIWFQGWNDAIGEGNPDYVKQMASFIRDIRKDLKAPAMPFVIGELGTDGPAAEGWVAKFRQQQAEIAALPEFKGTVALAKTAQYWPTDVPDLSAQWQEFQAAAKENAKKPNDDPTRLEPGKFFATNWERKYRQQLSYTSDKRYHYLGSGACYYRMGESMGRTMVELVK